jgi:hypothetical protein
MNDARPFLHVKNAGTKAPAVPAASARSDYEPDDRSTWENALDADHLAYRTVHAKLPSASLGRTAYSPPAVRAASQRNSGSLFSAVPSLTNSDCQIDQLRSNSALLAMRDLFTLGQARGMHRLVAELRLPVLALLALFSYGLTMAASFGCGLARPRLIPGSA